MKNQITERALACLNATNKAIMRSDYRDEISVAFSPHDVVRKMCSVISLRDRM
jgi:hypothetical protein